MNDPADRQSHGCADRLRRLPTEVQPPYNWQEFKRRARGHLPVAPGWTNRGWTSRWRLATAVSLLVVTLAAAVLGRVGGGERPQIKKFAMLRIDAGRESRDSRRAGYVQTPAAAASSHRAVDSKAIESWIATLPREPIVVHVGTRAAVARLEDRIAQVDDLLTAERLDGVRPDRLAALQRERVRLVGSLAQVRYAEVVASEVP